MRKKELYRILVHRYVSRTASPEELQVFFHLLEKGKLQRQLLEATQDTPAAATGRVRLMVRRYGVAAAVIIALAGTAIILLWRGGLHKDATPAFVSVLHNDIDPGGDRATLTLGDGSLVQLGSEADYNRLQNGRGDAAISGSSDEGARGRADGAGARGRADGAGARGRADGAGAPGRAGAAGAGGRGDVDGADGRGGERADGASGRGGANNHGRPLYRVLATPAGGQYRLTLADGTKVWLNSQSSIRFPVAFAGNTRLVEVTGEAYFDVAHDARRPFVVKAGKMIVQALGTEFNVHAYGDESTTKTTLIQGSVRVIEGADSLLLTPGQEGLTDVLAGNGVGTSSGGGGGGAITNSERITLNSSADTAQAAAWKDGYFDFDNLDIQAIMRQFARWYDIRIVFAGKPGAALFAGRLQRSLKLSQVMIGLGRMGVHSRLEGRVLTILP